MNEKLCLLPRPQRLVSLEGRYVAKPERFICLSVDTPDLMLRIGRTIQKTLEMIGQRLELTAVSRRDRCQLGVIVHIEPEKIPRLQGYCLTILSDLIEIQAHDEAGAFYAAMTLKQIVQNSLDKEELPCLHIEDWPDFPKRGVMLDISRDKVPTMDTLYSLIDMLAEWKINQFQLYTEHTFAYRNHREVWQQASPMTGEQIMLLDAYCRERFVELVPNQNSFGHMERWLVHSQYIHLAEAPNGFSFPWGYNKDPFSLCPVEPGSIELLNELYEELLPHFSSRQLNVGCDETYDLGQGKSKEECQRRGTDNVYFEFLLKIYDLVQKRGRTMQFWADMILLNPELLKRLPEDVVALNWGYEASHPFIKETQQLAEAGVSYYVCPGTSSWSSIAGRTENMIANLRNASENGLAHGAMGYMNTDWGDNGHCQPLPISFSGYAYGAAMSWACEANKDMDLPKALSLYAFQDTAGVVGTVAYDLGNAYKHTGIEIGNGTILSKLIFEPDISFREGRLAELTIERLEEVKEYIAQATSKLSDARMTRTDAPTITDEFHYVAALLDHACNLGIARIQADRGTISCIPNKFRHVLSVELKDVMSEYQRLWILRNREGGLVDSVARMNRLLERYQADDCPTENL